MTVFTTPRLRVREWTEQDFDAMREILSDPVTMRHWEEPLTEGQVRAWLQASLHGMREAGAARWCCERLEDSVIVGDVGIVVKQMRGELIRDLGYIIHHPYWRMGYGLEAAQGAIDWARAQGMPDLIANMAADNEPSLQLAEALGMQREDEFINPDNRDKLTYWYRLEL